jgi:glycine/D-amino acid oxidase-like deaminating enzyme
MLSYFTALLGFMHICILGAGVMGVTTAFYLAQSGCRITVFDQQTEVAAEASFGASLFALPSVALTPTSMAHSLAQYSRICMSRLEQPLPMLCRDFTATMTKKAKQMGVRFRFGYELECLKSLGGRTVSAKLKAVIPRNQGQISCQADAFVLAAGMNSRDILKKQGLILPVIGLKGHSFTLTHHLSGERFTCLSPWVDTERGLIANWQSNTVCFSIFEAQPSAKLRVNERARETLRSIAINHGLSSKQVDEGMFWTGVASTTPDGLPYIGPTHQPNVYVNIGHGAFGASLACGSSQLLADIISDRPTEIECYPYRIDRPFTIIV